jgi:single-strand DNA-binding protein
LLNRVILIGRLTRDPEMRYTTTGIGVCQFSLAVNRPFTNRAGEREVDFIDIVTWRQLAETCANYLGKGRLVAVEGRLQIRSYETQEGQKRRVAEVVADNVRFLDRPGKSVSEANEARRSSDVQRDPWEAIGEEVNLDNVDIIKDGDEEVPF